MSLTIRVLATELDKLGVGDVESSVRALQHFTEKGLLPLVGPDPGRGGRREFPPHSFLLAAILMRMRALGIPINVMQTLMKGLAKEVRRAGERTLLDAACKLRRDDPCIVFGFPG